MSNKNRNFVFTWNNYTDDSIDFIKSLPCKYVVVGKEIAPTTGTPHLQGFISWSSPRSLASTIKSLPGCHVEVAKTSEEAIAYCKKESDYIEVGNPPATKRERSIACGAANAERYDAAWAAAKSGDIEAVPADIRIHCYGTLKKIEKDYMRKAANLESETGVWICGPSRCGKTLKAATEYPEAYQKMANKWWDGYQQEDVVILEDLGKEHHVLGHHLKLWSDWRSFTAETKGGAMNIRPKKFVVTSQYRISDIWEDKETVDALKNRFTVIDMFPVPSKYAETFNL